MLRLKRAYSVQMSSEIPEADLQLAQKAEVKFQTASSSIDAMNDHLMNAINAFSEVGGLDPETVYNYRYVFINYKNTVKDNFNTIMQECVGGMKVLYEPFSADQQVNELCSALEEGLNDTKSFVDSFLAIFTNLDSEKFHNNLIENINSIIDSSTKLKQLIDDRVIKYIDKDVLAKDWKSFARDNLKNEISERIPMISKLYKERNQKVKG